MKWILLLSVLTLNAAAQSVDPCTGQATSAPVWTPPNLNQPIVCERETGRTVNFNSKGAAAWRYCFNAATGKFYPQTAVGPWADFQSAPGMALDIVQAGINADNATIQAILKKYSRGTFIDAEHAAVWCPFRAQIVAGIPAAPAWVTTSTVLYRINETDSGLGLQVGTVPRGAAVDPTGRRIFSRMTFCQWKGGTSPFKTFVRCSEKP